MFEQIIIGFLLFILIIATASTNLKRNKILCHFTGKDDTEDERWISINDDSVIFRGRKYDVIPERITSFWLRKGIHILFPTRVNFLHYIWNSRWPCDPHNYKLALIDPAVRSVMDKQEWVKAYVRGAQGPNVKKESKFAKYMPIIFIVLLVIVAIYFYNNMNTLNNHVLDMQNSLNAITR